MRCSTISLDQACPPTSCITQSPCRAADEHADEILDFCIELRQRESALSRPRPLDTAQVSATQASPASAPYLADSFISRSGPSTKEELAPHQSK